jgi:DNA-binding transcriptional MerR regulator
MEIKDTLNKPYTDKARADFIVENNHNKGYEIRETDTALQAWGYTEEEQQEQQQQKESEEKELALQAAIEELGKEMAKADLAGDEEWKADLRAEYEALIMESEG